MRFSLVESQLVTAWKYGLIWIFLGAGFSWNYRWYNP